MQLNGGLQTEQARGPRFNLQSSPQHPSVDYLPPSLYKPVCVYISTYTYISIYVCVCVCVCIYIKIHEVAYVDHQLSVPDHDRLHMHNVHIHPALKATIRMACSISILAKDTVYWILIHRIIITSVNARKCSSPPKETVYPLAAKPCLFLTSAVSDIY